MAINQLSTTNTFQEWLSATQQLIAVANTITDGYTLTTTSNIKLTGSGETLNVSDSAAITNLKSNSVNANIINVFGISGRDVTLNVANSIWVGSNVTITRNLTVGNVTITGTQVLACTEFGAMTVTSIIQPNGGRLTQSDGSSIIFRLAGNVQQLIANTNFFAGEIISTNVRNSLITTGNVVVTKNLSAGNINTSGNLVVSGNTLLGNGVHIINFSNQDTFRITNRGTGYSFVIIDETGTDPSPLAINGDGVFIKGDLSPFVTRVGGTTITPEIQQVGSVNANSSFASFTYSADATISPHYLMARSRGTKTSPTIVSEGDILGRISSAGWDGAKYVESSRIEFRIDTISGAGGVPALNDMPGEISFLITNDGESSPTERLKVNTSYIWANTQNFQLRSSSGKVTLGSFENLSTVVQTKRASNFIDSTFKISGQTLTDMGMSIFGFSGNGTVYPGFHFARANGTELAPQSVIDGSGLGYISAAGFHDGVTNFSPLNKFTEAARIQFVVQGDPAANSIPGAIDFFTSPGRGTGTSIINVVHSTRIDANGNVGIGTTAPVAGLHVVRNSSNDAVRILQAGTGNAFVVLDAINDATPFRIDGTGSVSMGGTLTTTGAVTINVSTPVAAALQVTQQGAGPAFQVLDSVPDTTMFRIDAGGNVGIGTGVPLAKVHISHADTTDALRVVQGGDGNALVVFDQFADFTPFRIDSKGDVITSGNVVVGTSSNPGLQTRLGTSVVMPKLKTSGSTLIDGTSMGIFSFSTGIAPTLIYSRARGTEAAPLSVINGTVLGYLSFNGYESNSSDNKFTEAARIDARVNGDPSANSIPSALFFLTSPGGAAPLNSVIQPEIRAMISNTGNVGIGTTGPTARLQVSAGTTFPALKVIQSGAGDAMVVQDALTDATPFRIDGSGNAFFGANLSFSSTNNGRTGNNAVNAIRFTDLDGTSAAGQPIGKIEFIESDLDSPGTAAYILCSSVSAQGGANLIFAASSSSGTDRNVVRIANSGIFAIASNTGIGYGPGSGSSVVQQTSRTTPVYIHAGAGSITLASAAGSTTAASFTVYNDFIEQNDVVIINQKSGTNLYDIMITAIGTSGEGNYFNVTFRTTGGTATDAPVFNFAIIKGSTF